MVATSAPNSILEARNVSQRFGGVQALSNVSLSVRPGEVLAVVGENGAGKSTLMKILAGVIRPSAGSLVLDGQPVVFSNVQRALAAGVALIHQELNLATNLNVGDNIFLGREPNRFGWIRRRIVDDEARKYLGQLGLDVSPWARVSSLPIGQQQLVEIAKALSIEARVLIMDEPTSSLSQTEADRLYSAIRQLREQGVAVVYISHRLNEVVDLADRVVVLRDGKHVGELTGGDIDRDTIVRMMVGRDISQFYHRTPHAAGKAVLEVRELRTSTYPKQPISFSVAAGEIVGLAGLMGAGRTELLTAIFGVEPAIGGVMAIDGKPFRPQGPAGAIDAGVVLAPEDRRQSGLVLPMGVFRNLSLASLRRRLNRIGFVRRGRERELCTLAIDQLGIKTAGGDTPVRLLSGGNQQKVVLGKWLATEPRVLLLDEPTRGIDVGSKSEIYTLMHELAGRGLAVLFASSEMEEIIGLSDRVLVMHQGRITGQLTRAQLSEESIMHLAVEQQRPAPASSSA